MVSLSCGPLALARPSSLQPFFPEVSCPPQPLSLAEPLFPAVSSLLRGTYAFLPCSVHALRRRPREHLRPGIGFPVRPAPSPAPRLPSRLRTRLRGAGNRGAAGPVGHASGAASSCRRTADVGLAAAPLACERPPGRAELRVGSIRAPRTLTCGLGGGVTYWLGSDRLPGHLSLGFHARTLPCPGPPGRSPQHAAPAERGPVQQVGRQRPGRSPCGCRVQHGGGLRLGEDLPEAVLRQAGRRHEGAGWSGPLLGRLRPGLHHRLLRAQVQMRLPSTRTRLGTRARADAPVHQNPLYVHRRSRTVYTRFSSMYIDSPPPPHHPSGHAGE